MEKTMRVKVLDTNYDEDRNLIKWLLKDLEENKDFTLAWLGDDLGNQFNIKGHLPPSAIRTFCEAMINKEFNLVMTSDAEMLDSESFKDDKKVEKANQDINKYPYQQVLDQLTEEGNYEH